MLWKEITQQNLSTKAFLQHKDAGLKRDFSTIQCLIGGASEASETLSGVYKFELFVVRCMYVYGGDVCHNSSACLVYVFLWAELSRGNGRFVSVYHSVLRRYCSKPILYLNAVHGKFSLCVVRVETGPYSCEKLL